jgi:hypothetical protein
MDDTTLQRIEKIEKWIADREKQQLVYPLDAETLNILRKYFMNIVDVVDYEAGVGSNPFRLYIGKQDNNEFEVSPVSLIQYTVDPATNYVYVSSSWRKFFDGDEVTLQTTGSAPAPLSAGIGTTYYVINSTDAYRTFQLSATSGGSAINITNTGSGRQFIE